MGDHITKLQTFYYYCFSYVLNIILRSFADGGNTALQVVAWPFGGRPGKVNVMRSSPNPATWIRAQVTFRKLD